MTSNEMAATYSPEDNKLRLYSTTRLDQDTYARVKAAGFSWAPRQDLFVAPMWTPAREDLLLELANEIGPEETRLEERADARAERFTGYSDKRESEAHAAHAHVAKIADGIPLGQPILVGHHSEKRARKDAARIEAGMKRAVRLWDTACYWEERARGVARHAAYKANPGLRARRIATLEADMRKWRRSLETATTSLGLWEKVAAIGDVDRQRAAALMLANVDPSVRLWSALDRGELTGAEAAEHAMSTCRAASESARRWIAHLTNRLAYERVLLGRAPDEETPKVIRKSAKAMLPLLNYRAPNGIQVTSRYRAGVDTLAQHEMTQAEYAKIHTDYKGTRAVGGTHRVRVAMMRNSLVAVFLTDSKTHPVPAAMEKAS